MTEVYPAEIAQEWHSLTGHTPPANLLATYYPRIASSDFETYGAKTLAAVAVHHWEVAGRYTGKEAVIDIHNPDPSDPDYSGSRTVIDIVVRDMRYLLSSLTADLTGEGYALRAVHHPQVITERSGEGIRIIAPEGASHTTETTTSVLPIISADVTKDDETLESWTHIEIDAIPETEFDVLREKIAQTIEFVGAADRDREDMATKAKEIAAELRNQPPGIDLRSEAAQAADLLDWLDGRFAFMGYREYRLENNGATTSLEPIPGTARGISALREPKSSPLSRAVASHASDRHVLVLTKANSRSKLIRRGFMDYLGVKTFDENGRIIGERRFVGLYTSSMYTASVLTIPVVREKCEWILRKSGISRNTHSGDELVSILETYPRDDMFHADKEEILDIAMSVVNLQEKREASVFIRRDAYERYVSVLVYVPRDLYDTASRTRVENVLRELYRASSVDFDVLLSDSALARLHFVVRVDPKDLLPDIPPGQVANRIRGALRSWNEDVREFLSPSSERLSHAVAQRGGLWAQAFPPSYQDDFTPHDAVADVHRFESMESDETPYVHVTRAKGASNRHIRLALYRFEPANLSDILPYMANLGAEVVDERPYHLELADGTSRYIYDFGLEFSQDVSESDFERIEDAFKAGWQGKREHGRMDKLIVAGLTWQDVALLRAFSHYLRQSGFSLSEKNMGDVYSSHPDISRLLVELFTAKFDPDFAQDRETAVTEKTEEVYEALAQVTSLDADRVLRATAEVIAATVRTNVFQRGEDGEPRRANVFKIKPELLEFSPKPRPALEMFVYSPEVEGVHLRFGRVARGGLRWSDRRDDFRTEVLGLVKAQMVKNALIVPTGAKGGFYPKRLPDPAVNRDAWGAAGQAAYEVFIHALLDVTDNLVVEGGQQKTVHPERTVRYDDDDTYLVVAADKGTARFSDVANKIAVDRGFWLQDAFASGGSTGYDHKAMAITSRGAWKSVERHFRELGVNTATDEFTVVGIGDMSGDVFGNGMLRSEHTRLVAAFDHRDIFIDPNPDAATSYHERKRLFELPRSSWQDYNRDLISTGGGVFSRSSKSIEVSAQAAEALGMKAGAYTAPDLIRAILCAPVDLVYNGGIGTYIKSESETHAQVGDKANDAVRVNGADLRARVVGEGGNLGVTQLGRIEAALNGQKINTDAVDNSAGVDSSDNEVNIKLLLSTLIEHGHLPAEERVSVLESMTDEVADLVLANNYTQNVVMGEARSNSLRLTGTLSRLMKYLENNQALDRAVEFLPTSKELTRRVSERGVGLTSPELAVLLAYVKMNAADAILASDVPDEPFMKKHMLQYFPRTLTEKYGDQLTDHPLFREIATAHLVNRMVDRGGLTYIFRLVEETGASIPHIARVFTTVSEVFDLEEHFNEICALDNKVDTATQVALQNNYIRLLDRASRWFVNQAPDFFVVEDEIARYRPTVTELRPQLPTLVRGSDRDKLEGRVGDFVRHGVPTDLSYRAAGMLDEYALLTVAQIAATSETDAEEIAEIYFGVTELIHGVKILENIGALDRSSRWTALARGALRDDYYQATAAIVDAVLDSTQSDKATAQDRSDDRLAQWQVHNETSLRKVRATADEVLSLDHVDQAPLSVLLRMIRSLVRSTVYQSQLD